MRFKQRALSYCPKRLSKQRISPYYVPFRTHSQYRDIDWIDIAMREQLKIIWIWLISTISKNRDMLLVLPRYMICLFKAKRYVDSR